MTFFLLPQLEDGDVRMKKEGYNAYTAEWFLQVFGDALGNYYSRHHKLTPSVINNGEPS